VTDDELRAKYPRVVERERLAGTRESTLLEKLRRLHHDEMEIAKGKCPKCGAEIVRYGGHATKEVWRKARHPGPPRYGVGEWVMYRCSRDSPPGEIDRKRPCGYAFDRYEACEAN
jgi:hypothetical protein